MSLFRGDTFMPGRPWRGLRAFCRVFVHTWQMERWWAQRAKVRLR